MRLSQTIPSRLPSPPRPATSVPNTATTSVQDGPKDFFQPALGGAVGATVLSFGLSWYHTNGNLPLALGLACLGGVLGGSLLMTGILLAERPSGLQKKAPGEEGSITHAVLHFEDRPVDSL